MKKALVLLLAVCMLLCGCESLIPAKTTLPTEPVTVPTEPVPETEPETVPETEPETEPAPVYMNPLNGEILDEPFTHRIFAVSINNLYEAIPHRGVINADLYFESFVNHSIVRGLALFTQPEKCSSIGSVRSDRMMFNDLCLHYDAVMVHAGGSNHVLNDCEKRSISNLSVDTWVAAGIAGFRDKDRTRRGYGYEHTLFALGEGIVSYAESLGIRTTLDPELNYNLVFADDGTPENGVPAEKINITLTAMHKYYKGTDMIYNAELDKYIYHQYAKDMVDDITGEPEAFTNVLILTGKMYVDNQYYRIDMMEGGTGWYANGGKAIPIYWGTYDLDQPIWLSTGDGEPVVLGRGNTYIAITETGSKIEGIGALPEA